MSYREPPNSLTVNLISSGFKKQQASFYIHFTCRLFPFLWTCEFCFYVPDDAGAESEQWRPLLTDNCSSSCVVAPMWCCSLLKARSDDKEPDMIFTQSNTFLGILLLRSLQWESYWVYSSFTFSAASYIRLHHFNTGGRRALIPHRHAHDADLNTLYRLPNSFTLCLKRHKPSCSYLREGNGGQMERSPAAIWSRSGAVQRAEVSLCLLSVLRRFHLLTFQCLKKNPRSTGSVRLF